MSLQPGAYVAVTPRAAPAEAHVVEVTNGEGMVSVPVHVPVVMSHVPPTELHVAAGSVQVLVVEFHIPPTEEHVVDVHDVPAVRLQFGVHEP